MATKGGHVNEASYSNEEHDHETYRKRVTSRIDGNMVVYEDTNFTSGDSPAVLDIQTDLGRIATVGHFHNTGPGDILIEVSFNGSVYGGQYTLSGGEQMTFTDETIAKIRITFQDPTGYKARLG